MGIYKNRFFDFFNNILEKENFEDFPKYFFRDKKFNKYLQNRDIMKLKYLTSILDTEELLREIKNKGDFFLSI